MSVNCCMLWNGSQSCYFENMRSYTQYIADYANVCTRLPTAPTDKQLIDWDRSLGKLKSEVAAAFKTKKAKEAVFSMDCRTYANKVIGKNHEAWKWTRNKVSDADSGKVVSKEQKGFGNGDKNAPETFRSKVPNTFVGCISACDHSKGSESYQEKPSLKDSLFLEKMRMAQFPEYVCNCGYVYKVTNEGGGMKESTKDKGKPIGKCIKPGNLKKEKKKAKKDKPTPEEEEEAKKEEAAKKDAPEENNGD